MRGIGGRPGKERSERSGETVTDETPRLVDGGLGHDSQGSTNLVATAIELCHDEFAVCCEAMVCAPNRFATAGEVVAMAVRHLPPGLASRT
ncbi:hypothetical protein ACIRPK_22305 [Kitasatospora sp. NPDC101801]|uniref:hypothetical protein n=1 Tax=Kitasatospora sp. NPDC101801 TaxID=3364103 RepID=UPI003822C674